MTLWIFDTGVWLQHLAVRSGAAAEIMADERNEVFTSPISLAEVVSVLDRKGHGDQTRRMLALMRESSTISPMSETLFEEAGRIHARERSFHRDFSMADALILAHAKDLGATLLTTDRPLSKNRQGVRAKLLS